ncbi:hypothetical protein RDABS01_018654 [Bienertia sinuspersici]
MAAFQQYPVSFLVDSVYLPNLSAIKTPEADEFIPNLNQFYPSSENSQQPLINYNQEGSSIDAHESSCLEQQSINEPSSLTEKQRTESLSMAEKADSGEQVIQSCSPTYKKRKSRKGSSSNSSNTKEAKQVKCKKQKQEKEVMEDEKNDNKSTEDPPKGYIHVRARRGQATDSHSLAERVRREKISERMKMLQALVPGCDKVTGKALMLDEIINYVQSLQNQVEAISNGSMSLPMPLMQHTSNGDASVDQPRALANTNALSCSTTSSASTPNFPASIVDSSANLFQQEQKPSLPLLQVIILGYKLFLV